MNHSKSEAPPSRLDILKLIAAFSIFLAALGAFYYFSDYSTLVRVIGLLIIVGVSLFIAFSTPQGNNLVEFVRESRIELRKVVWPTRNETLQTSLAVIVMVIIMGLLLWLLDLLLLWIVRLLTGQG
jgi:preprotein translocase subunit SecE